MDRHPAQHTHEHAQLHSAASWILTILVFLLPFIFVPVVYFPVHFSKMFVVVIGVLIALALWCFATLKHAQLFVPKTGVLTAGFFVVLATALSAFFSRTPHLSISGIGAETTTLIATILLFILFALIATLFNTRRRAFNMYIALFVSFFVMVIYHVARLVFGGDFLGFDIFTAITTTPIGGWYDLSVYFGLFTILSLIALEILSLTRFLRVLLYSVLALSLFFLAITNFTVAWMMIGGFALLFFVYLTTFNHQKEMAGEEHVSTRKTSSLSITVLIIAALFVVGEGGLGTNLSERFGIEFIDARPSWEATLDVFKASFSESPLVGSGPNTFREQWLVHKPDEINQTVFWNTDFGSGNGFFPTVFTTTGVFGVITWVVFIGLFVVAGIRAVLTKTADTFSYYVRISSFVGALYIWIFALRYNPSITILALAMVLSGLFIASLSHDNLIRKYMVSFGEKPKVGFFGMSAALICLLVVVFVGYHTTQRYVAQVLFQKGVYAINNTGDVGVGEELITRASDLNESDVYARSLVDVNVIKLNQIFSESGLETEEAVDEFQVVLSQAIDSAQDAVRINEHNYQNLLSLGRVYEAVLPLEIDGAYENASEAYIRAQKVAPKNPAILLIQARLERAAGNITAARRHILAALEMKSNYTEAIFLQSQIEAEAGNTRAAIRAAEDAARIAPSDETVFFQLGILNYNNNNFSEAVAALARAVRLNDGYANARYFLGLSLYEEGDVDGAIEQFVAIMKSNPGNAQIEEILANLRNGKAPIPAPEETETEDTLPIDESVAPAR